MIINPNPAGQVLGYREALQGRRARLWNEVRDTDTENRGCVEVSPSGCCNLIHLQSPEVSRTIWRRSTKIP